MSGRELAALLPSKPSPAGSTFDVVTVKSGPVLKLPDSSHPLNA